MKLKVILIFGILLLSVKLNAQTNFLPGYVIKNSGDTLFGEIDNRGYMLMSELCRFRLNSKTKSTEFYPEDIVAYRFKDGKYYISKEIEGKKVFLEYLIKGKASIYFMRDTQDDHYFISKEGVGFSELKYVEQIVNIDGVNYESKSKNHLAMLNYYMQDAPDIRSRIDGIGRPEHDNLIKLAEDYHHIVCNDESCITYEKKVPFLKVRLEIVGGIINYKSNYVFTEMKDFTGGNYVQGGLLAHLWMPRTNENLYFRTGILFSKPQTNLGAMTVFKIPMQFEYLYPKGIITPRFAVGINIYQHLYYDYSLMGGLNIRVNKKVTIGLNYDVDFSRDSQSLVLPGGIYTQSILTGIYYNL